MVHEEERKIYGCLGLQSVMVCCKLEIKFVMVKRTQRGVLRPKRLPSPPALVTQVGQQEREKDGLARGGEKHGKLREIEADKSVLRTREAMMSGGEYARGTKALYSKGSRGKENANK